MKSEDKIKRLVAKCKQQEWAAQKELYLLFADEMMSIAIRYSKDLSSAKDLVQDTFLTFFKKINQYDDKKGTLGAYLSRVLINNSFANYRRSQKMIYLDDFSSHDRVSEDVSALDKLEANDILELLADLPHGCRVVFNLKVIEGYSHVEIGNLINISASASRSQLTRAKKLLRVMILERQHLFEETHLTSKAKRGHLLDSKTKDHNGRAV